MPLGAGGVFAIVGKVGQGVSVSGVGQSREQGGGLDGY